MRYDRIRKFTFELEDKTRQPSVVANYLRLSARLIGGIACLFFLAILVGEAVASIVEEDFNGFDPEAFYVIIPMLSGITAYAVAWRWERLGGILLSVVYFVLGLAPSLHGIAYGDGFHFYVGNFILALPFLVTGTLFLIASRFSGLADR